MKKALRKSNLVAGILILVVVCVGIVLAGDVIVKEGTLDAENINAAGDISGADLIAESGEIKLKDKYTPFYRTITTHGADIFADRTLTLRLGDADRELRMLDDTTLADWFNQDVKTTATPTFASVTATGTIEGGSITTAGTIEGGVFKSTGCTATAGSRAVAFGEVSEASGYCSTAMGAWAYAIGDASRAMGIQTTASGFCSTAMGIETTAGSANFTTAIGSAFTNNVQNSFAVGFNDEDLRVTDDYVEVFGNLYVTGWVDGDEWLEHSTFYDKDTYGKALDYSEDSSETIKLNPQGEKEYNHEADPVFLQKWVTVKDYDKYTEEEVWDEVLNKTITRRIYETHQELRSNLSMKVAWLRQCVFELRQENQMLKDDIARLKEAVGIE